MLAWLRANRTAAVLVRPDHVVQAREPFGRNDHGVGADLADTIRSFIAMTSWRGEIEKAAVVSGRNESALVG